MAECPQIDTKLPISLTNGIDRSFKYFHFLSNRLNSLRDHFHIKGLVRKLELLLRFCSFFMGWFVYAMKQWLVGDIKREGVTHSSRSG